MLFLNTLDVKAANYISFDFSPTVTMTVHPSSTTNNVFGSVNGTISANSGGGTIRDGDGTISISGGGGSVHGQVTTLSKGLYTYHVVAPFDVAYNWDLPQSDYYRVFMRWNGSPSITVDKGTISNFGVYDSDHRLLFSSVSAWYGSSNYYTYDQIQGQVGNNQAFRSSYVIEFDWTYEENVNISAIPYSSDVTFNTTFNSFNWYVSPSSAPPSTPVTDVQANQNLSNIQSDTSTTASNTGGILSKITEFFGSFFSNLIGIFVPEEGYFSDWFTRLNTLLAVKLGMLYAPFDLLIQVLTSILNADDSFVGIPFPGIEWDGQYLVEPFTFTFSSLGDVYTDLQGYVYFGTDVILLLAFFGLLQDKIKHILED